MKLILAYFCAVSIATGSYFVIRILILLFSLLLIPLFSNRKLLYIWLRYCPPILTLTFSSSILIFSIQIFDLISNVELFYDPLTLPCYLLILFYLFLLENFIYHQVNRLPYIRKRINDEESQRLLIN